MSYCQGCPGSYGNIMYTFGSDYDGSGDVNDLANWPANPALVANYDATHQSIDPGRAAQKMYQHILSTAPSGCLALSSGPASLATPAPTPDPNSHATYDTTLQIPKCSAVTSVCDSGTLLDSRGTIGGKSEPNGAKNARSCTDGNSGSFGSDESVNRIKVSSVGGGNIQPGSAVEIKAEVNAYSATADWVDFYYATDASNPQWQLIKTMNPPTAGPSIVSAQYAVGNGSLQAVRVVMRYGGAASPCPGGGYDEADDLAFAVGVSAPPTTQQPVTPAPTSPPVTANPTPLPTPLPTALPTPTPTPKPTTKPTGPTSKPTSKPTVKPTSKPTSKPTAKPTAKPTSKPTNKPTAKPI